MVFMLSGLNELSPDTVNDCVGRGMTGGTVSESRTRRRFPLRLPVQIEAGQSKLKATTHDLSAGGVFIEADPSLRMGARVEFRLVLPAQLLGTPRSVTAECQGRVVRVQKPVRKHPDGKRQIGVACVLDTYKFVRKN